MPAGRLYVPLRVTNFPVESRFLTMAMIADYPGVWKPWRSRRQDMFKALPVDDVFKAKHLGVTLQLRLESCLMWGHRKAAADAQREGE